MGFSLSLPIVGQPHSTEDPKVGNDLTTISTWANGNIVDTDLNSPNNSVRRVLLQGCGTLGSAQPAGTYLLGIANGGTALVGSASQTNLAMWSGDAGLSSQPQDFQVANKTATGRIRVSGINGSVALGATFTFGLAPLNSVTGNQSVGITYGVGTTVGSVAAGTPGINASFAAESAAFTLPVAVSVYVLTCVTNATITSNALMMFTVQLLAYNA